MNAHVYGEALYRAIQNGMAPGKALPRLRTVLAEHGRASLYGRALADALHRFKKDEAERTVTITVAREGDTQKFSEEIQTCMDDLGTQSSKVVTDEKIIGGFIAQGFAYEYDQSYRRSLLAIYSSLTAAHTTYE